MMKKLTAILCCLLLLAGQAAMAAGDPYWECANCGNWSNTAYCSSCGYPRTEIALDGPNTAVQVTLNQRLATRSGPGTEYDELGSYFKAGTRLTALSAGWDERNEIWWVQVEFNYGGEMRRAYTGLKRLDMNVNRVRTESPVCGARVIHNATVYYGPGSNYTAHRNRIAAGTEGLVYWAENGYAQFETYDYSQGVLRRFWISVNDLMPD